MSEQDKKSRGVKKGGRRLWRAGVPRISDTEARIEVRIGLTLSQAAWLRKQGNQSAKVRELIDAARRKG